MIAEWERFNFWDVNFRLKRRLGFSRPHWIGNWNLVESWMAVDSWLDNGVDSDAPSLTQFAEDARCALLSNWAEVGKMSSHYEVHERIRPGSTCIRLFCSQFSFEIFRNFHHVNVMLILCNLLRVDLNPNLKDNFNGQHARWLHSGHTPDRTESLLQTLNTVSSDASANLGGFRIWSSDARLSFRRKPNQPD